MEQKQQGILTAEQSPSGPELVDINELRRVEAELSRRLSQQELMSEIAQSFAGAGDFEALTARALERIGRFLGVDIAYIAKDAPEEKNFICGSQWNRYAELNVSGVKVSYEGQPQAYAALKNGEADVINDLSVIPPEEFIGLKQFNVKSRVFVPLFIHNAFWGYFAVVSRETNDWEKSDLQLVKLLGGVFSVALERREAEERRYAAEQTLRTVIDNLSLSIFWKDTDSVFLGCNREFAKTNDRPVDEIIGKTDRDFLEESFAAKNLADDRRVLATGETLNVENRMVSVRGDESWVHVIKSPVWNEMGEITAIVGIFENITEKKRAELELRRMSAIVENAPLCISYVNKEGMFDYFNQATLEVTGFTRQDLMENGVHTIYDEETSRRVHEEIMPELISRGRCNYELPILRKDGEARVLSFSSFLVGDGEYNCATIATDVTESKRLADELIVQKNAAEAANTAKTDFLSRMSHEIRTPMNAIIGMTRIAREAGDAPKMQYCLEKIDTASRHLLGIINDILDMAKIEAHRMELSEHAFLFEKMAMDAVGVVTFLSEQKKQNLMVTLDKDLPRYIVADELRLKQVVTNLLSNAVKFTGEGGMVRLNVRLSERTGTRVKLLVEVVDNGIGVEKERLSGLFNAFEQGDGSITRRYGGTGLGLAICKRMVDMMGGEIWAESELGAGARFCFTFEAEIAEPEDNMPSGKTIQNLRILAIDDSADIRQYFTYVMDGFGIQCDVADSGEAALELVQSKKEADAQYDVIFVDWKMPGMDGVETARAIKRIVDGNTIIIMISILEWDRIEKEARAAGISKFISKPLFPSVLLDAITGTYDGRIQEASPAAAGGNYDFSGHRVLLAEDVDVNREIVAAMLEGTGVELEYAENGAAAVAQFARDAERYSLILMDIHMPEMDGYEATGLIRGMDSDAARHIPIIAMTADVFREDVEKCERAGMNAHISKPVERDELLLMLSRYLYGRKKKAKEPAEDDYDIGAFIDVEEGLRRVLGNRLLYRKLLAGAEVQAVSGELLTALAEKEYPRAAFLAHKIKGVAGNLSLTALYHIASVIEERLKTEAEPVQEAEELQRTARMTKDAISKMLGEE